MTPRIDGRQRLRRAREHLDDWVSDARVRAYEEVVEGTDPALSEADLRLLDRVDSDLRRAGGPGLWGGDEYGIVATNLADEEETPPVVCTYHPQIPSEAYAGPERLDDPTRDRLNDVLWDYCERVAAHVQNRLDAFFASATED